MNYALTKNAVLQNRIKGKVFSMTPSLRFLAIFEAAMIFVAGFMIYWFYLGFATTHLYDYSFIIFAISTFVIAMFHKYDLYDYSVVYYPSRVMGKLLGIIGITFLVVLSVAFALKSISEISRVWFFSWLLSSLLLIYLERNLLKSLFFKLAETGQLSRRMIIVGASPQSQKFLEQIHKNDEPWLNVLGIFDDRYKRIGSTYEGYPVLGSLRDALDFCRRNPVDDIIVSLPWQADARIKDIIRKLKELPIDVRLCPDLAGFIQLNNKYSTVAGIPMLDVVKKPLDGGNYILKMVVDKILGIFILILTIPLMLIIAIAIKLDSPGPVLFRQKRYGFNNQPFSVFKFRSMRQDVCCNVGGKQAMKDDPRVTPLGKFLRKTSLDELPQLFNVLQGKMSLIGPRPHAVNHDDDFSKVINGFFSRYRVKPGITGWAQVNGWRGETDTTEKLLKRYEHDIYYIENWSLFLDIKILLKTVVVVFSRKNAY